MAKEKKKKRIVSISLERRLTTYPHPKYYTLTIAYARNNIFNRAEAVESILKSFFDAMPQVERDKLMRIYDSMSTDERLHPHRI